MIIDSSVVVAILFDEPNAQQDIEKLLAAERRRMSVANHLEAAMVLEGRRGAAGAEALDRFIEQFQIELVPVTVEQAEAAREAWRRFGRGRHRAALNFGDCFAYALAATVQDPLLYKGDDFNWTDVLTA